MLGRYLSATQDYKKAEPILQEVLSIVQSRPDLGRSFELAFIEILEHPEQYSPLVVMYCMHVLRFPRVWQYASARTSQDPLRIDTNARDVLEACSDDWRLAAIFRRSLGHAK